MKYIITYLGETVRKDIFKMIFDGFSHEYNSIEEIGEPDKTQFLSMIDDKCLVRCSGNYIWQIREQ